MTTEQAQRRIDNLRDLHRRANAGDVRARLAISRCNETAKLRLADADRPMLTDAEFEAAYKEGVGA